MPTGLWWSPDTGPPTKLKGITARRTSGEGGNKDLTGTTGAAGRHLPGDRNDQLLAPERSRTIGATLSEGKAVVTGEGITILKFLIVLLIELDMYFYNLQWYYGSK